LYEVAPVTVGQEYAIVLPPQTPLTGPAIEAGVPGLLYSLMLRLLLTPIQFEAFTLKEPEVNVDPKVSVSVLVPCPETIDVLVGIVQV
jgi:hypothetical protein